MTSEQQNDILCINQVQLLLAEKRTALAIMRTGIAVLALPLSIFSALIATSKWYNVLEVWPLMKMHQYDRIIIDIKQNHSSLRQLIQS